ncbi:hypothetical protein Olsu_1535 [Olsenella uli DSM 7084]|uniref:Uncharacterized protein n=1 Tax=Olsenella uli (strain ATCC 49627 / DSM 7084 / CCUG 31166 / CIP 109912 / JCM 12494 / LMG 11480 / NCIMB 702895 / VPI D76D-27C) TaxID=633147 RepID=E1QWY1_OLSUV|nr:hypothetical protein [Olsenella uli]ADK68634.1 hypothetical protein Olsu_1535 [Olsenella uli DSM 7084]KRO12110.1 hypothetical protein IV77_GL001225 [Olsenella uli DSM 7084]
MTNVLGVASTAGFVLAGLLVLVAVILFFALHIPSVRNELTGRTAAAAIAQMRSMTWATRRHRETVARRLTADGTDAPEGEGGGSLHLRVMTPQLGRGEATTAEMDEAVTTLVTPARDAVDEAVTTLMEAGTESTGAWSADESKTILLEGDDTPKEGDGR